MNTAETTAETIAETTAVLQEVAADLENLKPNVILDTLKSWIPALTSFGYRLLAAAAIFFIGTRVIKFACKVIERTFTRMDMDTSIKKFLLSCIKTVFYGILIFIVADKIGISSASIVALLGSAGIAIGLALQGSLANFAGGVLILIAKPFVVGDYIITKDGEGTVASIGIIYTTLNTPDNKKVVIPNGTLSNTPLTNVTAQDRRRVDILVGIGYSSDLKLAKQILQRIFEQNPMIMKDMPVDIFVNSLDSSSVTLGARGWAATGEYWAAKWDITEQIKLEFDQAGIEIPFNQLDINIKK